MASLLDLCLRRPRATLVIAAVLTLLAAASIARLRPQTSLTAMFDAGNPSVAALERIVGRFPVAEELLVLATLPPDAPRDEERLRAVAERLEGRLAETETVAAVRYDAGPQFREFAEREVVPNGLLYLDEAGVAEAQRRLTAAGMAEQLARTRTALAQPAAAGAVGRALADDPLRLFELLRRRLDDAALPGVGGGGSDLFLTLDGRGLLVRIDGTRPPGDLYFARRLVADVDAAVEEVDDGLTVQTAGAYAVAAYDTGRIQWDSVVGTVTSVLGLALVATLLFRRPVRLFALAFAPVAVGIAWGFGAYAAIRPEITPLAAVIGGALGGIGIDYPLHFLAHYDARRRETATAAEAARATLAELGRPTFVAWLTSVIGFAAVAFSPVGTLRDFAAIGSLGLLGAGLATLTVLPAALVAFDRGPDARPAAPRFAVADRLAGLLLKRTRAVLLTTAALVVAGVAFVAASGRALSLELDLAVLHPMPNPPLTAQAEIREAMGLAGGTMFVHVTADSPRELVEKSHAVADRLRSDAARAGGVVGSSGLHSLLPDPSADVPAFDVAAVRQRLTTALADAGFDPAAFGDYLAFLGPLLAPADPPTTADLLRYPKVAALVLTRDALAGRPATEAVTVVRFGDDLLRRGPREAALGGVREALDGLPGVTATGAPALSSDLEAVVVRDLPWQFGVSLAVIAAVLAVHFRSVADALLALSPTIVSAVALLATMEALGLRLNLVNGVLVPLLLGINVDYGIFAVVAARSGVAADRLAPACAALLTCAATTAVGCGTLATTSVPAVQSLGVLIVAGVLGCFLGAVGLTLPALLRGRA